MLRWGMPEAPVVVMECLDEADDFGGVMGRNLLFDLDASRSVFDELRSCHEWHRSRAFVSLCTWR